MRGVFGFLFVVILAPLPSWASDWPHWRGPNRNDITPESSHYDTNGWLPERPSWEAKVGAGSTSPLVVDGKLYTMGWKSKQDTVLCLDAETGRELWRQSYPSPEYGRNAIGDQVFYVGPSSTPEFDPDTGLLYTLSIDGDLHCWDTTRRGAKVWHLNLYERYKMPRRPRVGRSGQRDYGYTSSPLVQGDTLIVEVGGPAGNLMGFDKKTGRQRWRSRSQSHAGHNGGPVPITVEGVPCVAVHNFDGLLVCRIDARKEGQTVATYPWVTDFANNIATLAVHEDRVVMTSAYNHYLITQLKITLRGASKVWEQKFASKVCSPIIHKGHVYWAWQSLMCLDFETGKLRWKGGRFSDPGSCIITGDDRIITLGDRGELVLAETAVRSPDEYRVLESRSGLFRTWAWPHVVLSHGRLYCKDRDGNLLCFDLKGASGE